MFLNLWSISFFILRLVGFLCSYTQVGSTRNCVVLDGLCDRFLLIIEKVEYGRGFLVGSNSADV